MFNFKTEWFPIALILFLFSSLTFFYLSIPELKDQVNYLKTFLVSIISLLVYVFFYKLPLIDSDNNLYQKNFKAYCAFRDILLSLLTLIQSFFILSIFNYSVNTNFYLPLFIAALFFILSRFIIKFKINVISFIYTPVLSQILVISSLLVISLIIIPKTWYLIIFLLITLINIIPFLLFLVKSKKNKSN